MNEKIQAKLDELAQSMEIIRRDYDAKNKEVSIQETKLNEAVSNRNSVKQQLDSEEKEYAYWIDVQNKLSEL